MPIINNKGLTKPFKNPPKRNKKKEVHTFKCTTCKDSGIILHNNLQLKCHCRVKKEFDNWLDPTLKFFLKRKGQIILNQKEGYMYKNNPIILFKDINKKFYRKQIILLLLNRYYENYMNISTYYQMTGNSYTEAYVVGEHSKFLEADMLFISLGNDNYNKTLETTIYSLITRRLAQGKITWIYLEPQTDETELINLYGLKLNTLIKQEKTFNLIYTKEDNKIHLKKNRK